MKTLEQGWSALTLMAQKAASASVEGAKVKCFVSVAYLADRRREAEAVERRHQRQSAGNGSQRETR